VSALAALRPRRPGLVTALVLGVVVLALGLRLWELGVRAMHHDESLHAMFSWYFAEGRGYRHDPLMHGPFQFHVIAALFKLFGSSDFVARIPAALAGTALVATPLLLRRWLGGAGTVATAAFFALSPSLLYFSRFARNDAFIALFTVLMVVAIWRYRDDGRLRWLLLLAAMLALGFATKEVIYLTAAVFLLALNAMTWRGLVAQIPPGEGAPGWRRRLMAAGLLPSAWAVVALWPLLGALRRRLGLASRTREGELLLVMGTLTATQLAAAVQLPLEAAGVELAGRSEVLVGTATGAVLLAGAAAAGLAWRWRWWAACFGLFALITVPLFTTFFTNMDGFVSGFWGGLDYWLAQQEVQRGEQPRFYYLMMLPIYELWLLVPAVLGGAWLLARRDGLAALLAWWFLGSLVALSYAGEKMPWLLVHLATPLALLAGLALGQALPRVRAALWRPDASARAWMAAGGGGMALALLAVLALRTGLLVSFAHPDTPVEPLIYTQTTPDVPRLTREIIAALDGPPETRRAGSVIVDTTASLSWPWAWYLREVPAGYLPGEGIRRGEIAEDAILIVAQYTLDRHHRLRQRYEEAVPYRHRWWFPEEGYRRMTWGRFTGGLRDGSLPGAWLAFMTGRIDRQSIGSLDGEVLFPRVAGAAEP
jgi:uncharacterized protein (TIGR03663 family)